jgi:hypothetical protein
MLLRPVNALFHTPQVDDVTNQVEIFRIDRLQKIQQKTGLASFESQMHVGYPYSSVLKRAKFDYI